MITPRMWADRGRRRAVKLGLDPDRLPPGQSPTQKWPVLSVGESPYIPMDQWSFSVQGEVEEPFAVDWEAFLGLEQTQVVRDIHCVTRWSRFDVPWEGVRVRDLLERARPTAAATHALVRSFGGYTTNLPLVDLLGDDVLIAHRADGEPLERDHGGPARLLVPHRYFWKSAKWVRGIELLPEERLGFWERNGYHHRGDPWAEERHAVSGRGRDVRP